MLQLALAICSMRVYHKKAMPVVSPTLIHSAGLLSLFSWRKAGQQQYSRRCKKYISSKKR